MTRYLFVIALMACSREPHKRLAVDDWAHAGRGKIVETRLADGTRCAVAHDYVGDPQGITCDWQPPKHPEPRKPDECWLDMYKDSAGHVTAAVASPGCNQYKLSCTAHYCFYTAPEKD